MYVFVSWAFTSVAEEKFLQLCEATEALPKDEVAEARARIPLSVPEYKELTDTLASKETQLSKLPLDALNRELLAVKIAIPQLESVTTFQLAKRLPGSDKLPVSLAVRSFLLNTFAGEWSNDITVPSAQAVVFVGLPGLRQFFVHLAYCTAALGQSTPPGLLLNGRMVETSGCMQSNSVRPFLEACSFNAKDEETKAKYDSIRARWTGVGCSAEIDNLVLLSTAAACGFCGKG